MSIFFKLTYRAAKVLILEGPNAFWNKVKFHLSNTQNTPFVEDMKQSKTYQNYNEYINHATLVPFIKTPYLEEDLRIIGYMETLRKYKQQEHEYRPQEKLVTIIMPTYNRENYIGYAVESVLKQNYINWELLIIDDGSTDNTKGIIKNFSNRRVKYYYYNSNKGPAYARNRALEKSKGEYICYLDSDNTLHEDFILIMMNELLDNPDFDAAYCAQKLFNYNSDMEAEEVSVRFGPFNRSMLENRNYIDLGTIMHHRSVIEKFGFFNESMRRLVDWEYILRFTTEKHMKMVPCLLSNYYYSASSNQVTFTESMDKAKTQLHQSLKKSPLRQELSSNKLFQDLDIMFSIQVIPELNYKNPVSIVIPSYECLDYLRLCISSIEAYTTEELYEIIVVDNGSSEEVNIYLDSLTKSSKYKYIKNPKNYGFTYAVNQGIDAANSGNDIILMNNDAVVTKCWLEGLQEVLDYFPNAGIVAPRQTLLPYTKTMKIHCPEILEQHEADVNISLHHGNLVNPLLYEKLGLMELNFAPFFCAYVTRSTIEQLGALDIENGPHYRSDRLYCDAVRHIAGKKIVYTPRAKVYHLLQKSTDILKAQNKELYTSMYVNNRWKEILHSQ